MTTTAPQTATSKSFKLEGPQAAAKDEFNSVKNKQLLLDGAIFLKYGTWGEPGERIVYLSRDFKLLEWRHIDNDRPSGYVPVSSLIGIKFGRMTKNFKRRPPQHPDQETLSFSIIGEKRNLDLEASSREHMNKFLEALISLIRHHKATQKKRYY